MKIYILFNFLDLLLLLAGNISNFNIKKFKKYTDIYYN